MLMVDLPSLQIVGKCDLDTRKREYTLVGVSIATSSWILCYVLRAHYIRSGVLSLFNYLVVYLNKQLYYAYLRNSGMVVFNLRICVLVT